MTFYSVRAHDKLKNADRDFLEELGFPLPPSSSAVAAARDLNTACDLALVDAERALSEYNVNEAIRGTHVERARACLEKSVEEARAGVAP